MTLINVLLVDDDETDRFIAQRQLGKSDRIGRVLEVGDGVDAYALFAEERLEGELGPHPPRTLVLLDINMPRMTGFELLERLDEDGLVSNSEIVVVAMLTSSTYFGDRERAESFSTVEGYIEKPLTVAKLEPLLDRLWPESASQPLPS